MLGRLYETWLNAPPSEMREVEAARLVPRDQPLDTLRLHPAELAAAGEDEEVARESSLPEATRFHDLRHSYAAMLIAEGAHPRAIMERLGHSTIQVTLGRYGHVFPSLEASLTAALDDLYRSAEPAPPAEVHTIELDERGA